MQVIEIDDMPVKKTITIGDLKLHYYRDGSPMHILVEDLKQYHKEHPNQKVSKRYNALVRSRNLAQDYDVPLAPRNSDPFSRREMRKSEGRTRERMYPRGQELGVNVYARDPNVSTLWSKEMDEMTM